MFRKNTSGQFLTFQLVSKTDGSDVAGATVAVRRCIDGTFADATGTVTEDTGGFYKFAMSQADTNGNNIGFRFSATGAVTVEKSIVTTAADPTDSVRLGLTALPNAAAGANGGLPTGDASGRVTVGAIANGVIAAATFAAGAFDAVWTVTTRLLTAGSNIVLAKGTGITGFNDLDAAGIRGAVGMASANLDTQLSGIDSKTTNLPSDPADESLIIAATDAIAALIGTPASTVSADIAAVKSDSAAIKLKTDNLPSDPADASDISARFDTLDTSIATVDGNVDNIKTKTDSLTFTKALELDVNLQSVNGVTVTGTGATGDEWGP